MVRPLLGPASAKQTLVRVRVFTDDDHTLTLKTMFLSLLFLFMSTVTLPLMPVKNPAS